MGTAVCALARLGETLRLPAVGTQLARRKGASTRGNTEANGHIGLQMMTWCQDAPRMTDVENAATGLDPVT